MHTMTKDSTAPELQSEPLILVNNYYMPGLITAHYICSYYVVLDNKYHSVTT